MIDNVISALYINLVHAQSCFLDKSEKVNWSKYVKPRVSFFHRHNAKLPNLIVYFKKYRSLTQLKLDNNTFVPKHAKCNFKKFE